MMSTAQAAPVELPHSHGRGGTAAQVRRFSFFTGLVVIVVVACTWGWRAHHDPSLFASGIDDPYYPWEADQPGTATWSGDTMSGPAGSSVLHVDAADRPTEPLAMTSATRGPFRVYFTEGASIADMPVVLGHVRAHDVTVLPTGEDDLTLWFSADRAWTIELASLGARPFDAQVSGETDTYLHYTGSGGPHLVRLSCLAPQRASSLSTEIELSAYGEERLAVVRCPGESSSLIERVPSVLEVSRVYPDTEWTLTLEPQPASSEPEPSPGG